MGETLLVLISRNAELGIVSDFFSVARLFEGTCRGHGSVFFHHSLSLKASPVLQGMSGCSHVSILVSSRHEGLDQSRKL